MSAHPAWIMAAICIGGGILGYVRTQSIPSIVAGTGVGSLYAWSGYTVGNGGKYGYEGALAASILLFCSSAPRVMKGPLPATLTVASSVATAYYGKTVYDLSH